jgi:hypothetical protein
MRRQGRRYKQPLDGLKEKKRYWNLKEALDHSLWRTRVVRGYGTVQQMNAVYHNTTFFRVYLKHRFSTKRVLSSDLQITTILLLCIQLLIPTSPTVLIPI